MAGEVLDSREAPPGQRTKINPRTKIYQKWQRFVEAAARDFVGRFFSEDPTRMNEYADHEEKGFLLPKYHGWNADAWEEDLKKGDKVYAGFFKEAEYSRVREKSTGLWAGEGTNAGEEVIKAAQAFSWKELNLLRSYILEDKKKYLPRGGEWGDSGTSVWGDHELTADDVDLGIQLFKVYKSYYGFNVSLSQGDSDYFVGTRDKLSSGPPFLLTGWNPKIGTWEDEATARVALWEHPVGWTPAIWSQVSVPTGMHNQTESLNPLRAVKNEISDTTSEGFLRLEARFPRVELKSPILYRRLNRHNVMGQVLKEFVARVARNNPLLMRAQMDKVIEGLLTDTVSTDTLLGDDNLDMSFDKAPEEPEPATPRELKPIDLQCFLMENIGLLADYKAMQKSPYENLMQLYGSDAPGETISILNCKGKDAEVKRLLNLTPSTYASLVPYIKLYRLSYTNADNADPLVPIAQQEIPIPNYMDPADIARITNNQLGRNSGWGLQSFTWKLDGLQPATVDNNISANLKLYFQSVDDLFKGSRNADGRDQAGREQPGPLDLLIPSEACREKKKADDPPIGAPPPPPTCGVESQQAKSQGRDGACFRIKVVAGWATPPNLEETHPELKKKVPGSHETEGEILRRALRDTRITLYLQQTRHNLSFNENGSVLLSIDYQAALSGILTDNRMDILGTNDTAIAAKLREFKTKAEDASADMKEIASLLPESEVKDDPDWKRQKELQREYLQEQIDLQNQDKLKKYKRFLSRLYGRHEGGMSESPKMYVMEVDPKLVRQKKLADERDPEVRAKRARQLMTNSSALRGWAITNPLTYEAGKSGQNSDLLELLEGVDTLEQASDATDEMNEQFQNKLYSGKNMYIPYFYLGDLIDSILQNNDSLRSRKGQPPSSFAVFLAPMHVTNPLLLYQAPEKEQTQLMCASYDSIDSRLLLEQLKAKGYIFDGGVKKRINIGQIPIALDQFNVWFKNKVVKGGLDSYYLLHFIKDICAQLITDALKTTCFNNNIINDIRFDVSHIHFNNRTAAGAQRYPDGPKHTVPIDRLAELMGNADTLHRDVPPVGIPKEELARYNMTSGLVLFCTDAKPRNRRGRKGIDSDRRVGIYHNYVGSPVGLLKKLTFSRMQQQYLRESKLQKFGNLGAEQLRELYSANLELVGNTLYKNGQYTFLWPSAMTSGDDSRIVNLGLGGYFLIKSVDHTISPAGYTVRMTALQEGMEIGDEAEVTLQPVDGDISPSTDPYFTTEDGRALAASKAEQAAAEEAERIAAVQAARAAAAATAAAEEANDRLIRDLEEGISGTDSTGASYATLQDERIQKYLDAGYSPANAVKAATAETHNERSNDNYDGPGGWP